MILKVIDASIREVNSKSGIAYDIVFNNGIKASKVAIFGSKGGNGLYSCEVDRLYLENNKDIKFLIGKYVLTKLEQKEKYINILYLSIYDIVNFRYKLVNFDVLHNISTHEFELLRGKFKTANQMKFKGKIVTLDTARRMIYPIELNPLINLVKEISMKIYEPLTPKNDYDNTYSRQPSGFCILETKQYWADISKTKSKICQDEKLLFNLFDIKNWDYNLLSNYINELNSYKLFLSTLKIDYKM